MKLRMANITFGLVTLLITAGLGGMILGFTFNANSVQDGNHILSLSRFYLREGHSHGNFMAIYNILVGLILNNLNLKEGLKKLCSYAAMVSIFLPVGLFVKGATGNHIDDPQIGTIGIIGIFVSLVIMIYGAFKTKST